MKNITEISIGQIWKKTIVSSIVWHNGTFVSATREESSRERFLMLSQVSYQTERGRSRRKWKAASSEYEQDGKCCIRPHTTIYRAHSIGSDGCSCSSRPSENADYPMVDPAPGSIKQSSFIMLKILSQTLTEAVLHVHLYENNARKLHREIQSYDVRSSRQMDSSPMQQSKTAFVMMSE